MFLVSSYTHFFNNNMSTLELFDAFNIIIDLMLCMFVAPSMSCIGFKCDCKKNLTFVMMFL